jgi:CheY-like chemotaxis protein
MADVLLVDDNGTVSMVMAIALRRYGHAVTVAEDARQALNYLQRHQFGFLVSDVRMAGMNGIELAIQARKLPHPPRIILMSAYSNIEAYEGIAEAFLRKPIDVKELHALLDDQSATNSSSNGKSPDNAPPQTGATSTPLSSSPPQSRPGASRDAEAGGNAAACDSIARRTPHPPYGIVFG